VKGEWIFRGAVILSLAVHGALLVFETQGEGGFAERIIKIPVMIEAEPPPPPPPPPPPKPEKPPEKKARPKRLANRIKKVVEGEGLRTGEIVDAEVGDYNEEVAPEPEPPPPPPPPPPPKPKTKPEPKIDKVTLARTYLAQLRGELMSHKRYPLSAQRMGVTGAVTVSFVVDSDSSFSCIVVKRSSGHDILDKAALATVTELSGKIQRPAALGENELKTSVVLRYEMNG
jgi:periplasmic protein TonB